MHPYPESKGKQLLITPQCFDSRGNIYINALDESLWALSLLEQLSKQDEARYKELIIAHNQDHQVPHQGQSTPPLAANPSAQNLAPDSAQDTYLLPQITQPLKDWIYYLFQEDKGHCRRAQIELNWEFASFEKGGLSPEESKIHESLREDSIFAEETRGRRKAPKRSASVSDKDAGLISRRYPSRDETKLKKLWDYFPHPIFHAKGAFIRKEVIGGIDESFKQTGAPFIAGASGSIERDIFDLRRSAKKGLIPQEDIEKWIIIFAANLILAGHHSLSEVLIVAQHKALGYFQAIADPRENYAAFIQGLSSACKKYQLFSEFTSLSEPHASALLRKGLNNIKCQLLFKRDRLFKELGSFSLLWFLFKINQLLLKLETKNNKEDIIPCIAQLEKKYYSSKKILGIFQENQAYFKNAQDIFSCLKNVPLASSH